jgi:Xaa-Pro aminopeptidase
MDPDRADPRPVNGVVGARALTALGVDALVTTDPGDVTWLSGFSTPDETWPTPREVATAAVLGARGQVVLVLPDVLVIGAPLAEGVELRAYALYDLSPDLARPRRFARAVAGTMASCGLGGGTVAVAPDVPVAVVEEIRRADGKVRIADPLRAARAIKSADEISAIRGSAALCDRFQAAVAERLRPGISEIELFAAARAETERSAGRRLSILGDLVSGPRCLAGGGVPSERIVEDGEPVLSDVSIAATGYWADNCTTPPAGSASEEYRRVRRVVREALLRALSVCRAGATAGDVDAAGRSVLARSGLGFGHHLGHGVGASPHEAPRIVPGSTATLAAGMVVCLEPAAFTGTDTGVRLEVVGVVRDDGLDPLSEVPAA